MYGALSEPIRNDLLELQRLDPFVTNEDYKLVPTWSQTGSERDYMVGSDGLLRFKGAVYVPRERALRSEIIHMYHDDETAGHFGVRRTLELIRRKYFWQSLRKDVKDYIKTCAEC